jgi:hypothetical protein
MCAVKRNRYAGLILPDDEYDDDMPELTEPIIVPRVIVSGMHVKVTGGMVLIDGWEDLKTVNGLEHRVVGRGAMTIEVAQGLLEDLLAKLPTKR